MEYKNYSVSKKLGKLYLKSKTPQEGYEEVTYGTNNEKKTYHKYISSIKGIPSFFEAKEIEWQGKTLKFLSISLVDGDVTHNISVNSKNKGGYTDEAKALLSSLKGLELGREVSVKPAKRTSQGKNGKTYDNLSIYINYLDETDENGKNPSTGYIHFNDIPKPDKKELAGDVVWDWTKQTVFYYEVQKEIEAKFKGETAVSSEKPFDVTEENDDLPF